VERRQTQELHLRREGLTVLSLPVSAIQKTARAAAAAARAAAAAARAAAAAAARAAAAAARAAAAGIISSSSRNEAEILFKQNKQRHSHAENEYSRTTAEIK
jgi:hypothetical protein